MPATVIPGFVCRVLRDEWIGPLFLQADSIVELPEPIARGLAVQRVVEIQPLEAGARKLIIGDAGGGVDNTGQIDTVRQVLEAQLAVQGQQLANQQSLLQQILNAPGAPAVQVELARDPILSTSSGNTGITVVGTVQDGDAIGTPPLSITLQWQVLSGTWQDIPGADATLTAVITGNMSLARTFGSAGSYRLAATPLNGVGPTAGATRYSQPVVITAATFAPSFQVQPFLSTNAPVQDVPLTLNRGTASANPAAVLTSRLVRVSSTNAVTDLNVTGTSYTPSAADVGSRLRLDVTATSAGFAPVLASSVLTSPVTASAPATDSDAQAYFTAVTAAGGTVPTIARDAWEACVIGLKADGLWTKLTHVQLLLSNFPGLGVQQKGSATTTFVGLSAGDFTLQRGMRANGTGYINTGITITDAPTGSLGAYLPPDQTITVSFNMIGVLGSAGAQLYRLRSGTGTLAGGWGGALETGTATQGMTGFTLVTRRSNTDAQSYRDGVSVATTTAAVTPANIALPLFAMARNGGTNGGVSGPAQIMPSGLFFGGYLVADALNTAEVVALNARITTLMTAIGRTTSQSIIPAAPTFRDAIDHPFTPTSPWNIPLGADAVLVDFPKRLPTIGNTTNWTDFTTDRVRMFGTTGGNVARILRGTSDWPSRLYANTSQPVHPRSPVYAPDGPVLAINSENQMGVWIRPDGTVDSDQPLYRETGTSEFHSAYTQQGSPIPRYNLVSDDGRRGSQGGSGTSAIGACLRVGEMRPGPVGSGGVPGLPGRPKFGAMGITFATALNMSLPSNGNEYNATTNPGGAWRWPATKRDSAALNPVNPNGGGQGYGRLAAAGMISGIAMGALLAIRRDVTPASLGLETVLGELFLWTLQHYGCYIKDEANCDYSPGGRDQSEQMGLSGYRWVAQGRGDNETTNPALDWSAQVNADFGFNPHGLRAWMSAENTPRGAWVRDQVRLIGAFHLVADNTAATPGGAGERVWWVSPPATFVAR